jgi:conjugative relaxase-like TrwC/TraI family protein
LGVLTVAKVAGSGAAAYGAYLEGRTQAAEAGDYYLAADGERVEAPGRWLLGEQGAAALGVDVGRSVVAEEFRAVMAVQNPATGGRLRAVGAGGSAVAAIDATFSAPKSVSAVWALAGPELRVGIELAQEHAVEAALAYAVARVPMVRRRVDRETVVRETPAEVLASSWRHTTARAVSGRAPDPQLHSHVVLHGAVREGDGKVVAIESRAWLVHQREVGAAYRAQLAVELGRLGFGVEAGTGRGGRYFELSGVPESLLEAWSGRHRQVQAAIEKRLTERVSELRARAQTGGAGADAAAARLVALERSGQLMPAEQRAVAMRTRAQKGEGALITAGDLDEVWWQTAREHGFDGRSVAALRDLSRQPDLSGRLAEDQLEQRILGRLTEFDATFAAREARAVALEAIAGQDPERALTALARLSERGEILELADGRQTTRTHRGAERRALTAARALSEAAAKPIGQDRVEDEIAELRSELALGGMQLAEEQEQAMRLACSSRQLSVIVGQAGTGKSTALTAVARAHQAAGQTVVVTSTAAQAAQRLAGEFTGVGIRTAGASTMALRAAVGRGTVTLGPGVTIIHDEAALASTREQAWLLETVAESGARLIEVGDPRQSQAVGAGGLWPAIEAAAGEHGGVVELSRIVRAQDAADRRDQAQWRAGEHQQALEGYAARGRVHFTDTPHHAEDDALDAAHADRRAHKSTLVVTQTSNEQLDALNARAQALRVQDGELGDRELPLTARPYGLHEGDEVVLRAASTHPQLGAVPNGTRGQILTVDEDAESATLRLSDGRETVWDRGQLDQASARLSYVSHTFPAQGQTVEAAHVIAGEHADQNGTYVALTRARERTHLYASTQQLVDRESGDEPGQQEPVTPLAQLAAQLGRQEPELPSIAVPLAAHEAHERVVTQEIDHESQPVDVKEAESRRVRERDELAKRQERLERAREQRDHATTALERARQEREVTARVMASVPRDPQLPQVIADGVAAAHQAHHAASDADQLDGQLGELGAFRRLGERGRSLRTHLTQAREREQQALERQQAYEQGARDRQAQLDQRRQAWDAQHPHAAERHQAAQRAYAQAQQRDHAAEQTYDLLLGRDVVQTAAPDPQRRRWPRPPENPVELERSHELEREHEGPSFGF